MISKLLHERSSKNKGMERGNCIKIIKKEFLLEKIKGFTKQKYGYEFLLVGLIRGTVDSLSLPERLAIWEKIGEIIEEARKMGVKVVKHGITVDGRIFLVLAK